MSISTTHKKNEKRFEEEFSYLDEYTWHDSFYGEHSSYGAKDSVKSHNKTSALAILQSVIDEVEKEILEQKHQHELFESFGGEKAIAVGMQTQIVGGIKSLETFISLIEQEI